MNPYYSKLENNPNERQKQYRDNITAVMQEDLLKKIRTQLYQGIYGDDDFIQTMKHETEV